jgi:hypothetical protein
MRRQNLDKDSSRSAQHKDSTKQKQSKTSFAHPFPPPTLQLLRTQLPSGHPIMSQRQIPRPHPEFLNKTTGRPSHSTPLSSPDPSDMHPPGSDPVTLKGATGRLTSTLSSARLMSTVTMSPFLSSARGPPSAASGVTWPTMMPWEAPGGKHPHSKVIVRYMPAPRVCTTQSVRDTTALP